MTTKTNDNTAVVERMTAAIFALDRPELDAVFTDDLEFHLRGPFVTAGDHEGIDGLLAALGAVFEATQGQVELEQRFCIGEGDWAAEWEHARLHRKGRILESDNALVYRFEDGRIAEMWMYLGAVPEVAASFFA